MTLVKNKIVVPSKQLANLLSDGSWTNGLLKASMDLHIFSALKSRPKTAADVALELKLDLRGTELMLDALVGQELLTKSSNKTYSITEMARHYFLPASPTYIGEYMKLRSELQQAWSQLAVAIKNGKPLAEVNKEEVIEQFFPRLAAAIFPMSYAIAQATAEELSLAKASKPLHVLDVAAGSGVWSIAMAEANQKISVDALDFPAILEVTKNFVRRHNVANQYSYLEGNWQDVTLKSSHYDVVVLGHILHSEGSRVSKQLLRKCFEALKPGGTIVVAEMFVNDERTAPPFSLLFAINMFLMTTEGCVFSETEMKNLLTEIGFKNPRLLRPENHDPRVMVAQR